MTPPEGATIRPASFPRGRLTSNDFARFLWTVGHAEHRVAVIDGHPVDLFTPYKAREHQTASGQRYLDPSLAPTCVGCGATVPGLLVDNLISVGCLTVIKDYADKGANTYQEYWRQQHSIRRGLGCHACTGLYTSAVATVKTLNDQMADLQLAHARTIHAFNQKHRKPHPGLSTCCLTHRMQYCAVCWPSTDLKMNGTLFRESLPPELADRYISVPPYVDVEASVRAVRENWRDYRASHPHSA
jgi:hypothetical protein